MRERSQPKQSARNIMPLKGKLFETAGPFLNRSIFVLRKDRVQTTAAIAISILLLLMGFPQPNIDDVWYVDPAINLATEGTLVAPALRNVTDAFASPRFLLNVPFHVWLLAFWLKITGVSSFALCAFQVSAMLAAALSQKTILRHFKIDTIIWWPILVALIAFSNRAGLRPEVMALALGYVGMVIMLPGTIIRLILGMLLGASAILTSLNSLPFIVVLYVATILGIKGEGIPPRDWLRRVALAGAVSFLLSGFLFYLAIQGDLRGFKEQITAMVQCRAGGIGESLQVFVSYFSTPVGWKTFVPIYLLYLATIIIFFTRLWGDAPRVVRATVIASMAGLMVALAYRANAAFSQCWPYLFTAILVVGSSLRTRVMRMFLVAITVLALAWAETPTVAGVVFAEKPNEENFSKLRSEINNHTGSVAVDEYAARFVFDYNLPPGAVSYYHQHALPNYGPSLHRKERSQLWMVAKHNLRFCNDCPQSALPRLQVGRFKFRSAIKDPYDIVLFPTQ